MENVIFLTLQMRKLRYTHVKRLIQEHVVSKPAEPQHFTPILLGEPMTHNFKL